jgi:hypothetical protein
LRSDVAAELAGKVDDFFGGLFRQVHLDKATQKRISRSDGILEGYFIPWVLYNRSFLVNGGTFGSSGDADDGNGILLV